MRFLAEVLPWASDRWFPCIGERASCPVGAGTWRRDLRDSARGDDSQAARAQCSHPVALVRCRSRRPGVVGHRIGWGDTGSVPVRWLSASPVGIDESIGGALIELTFNRLNLRKPEDLEVFPTLRRDSWQSCLLADASSVAP